MAKYRAERIHEIKAELGEDVAAALERNAQLLLKTLKSTCKIGGSAGDTFDGVKAFQEIEKLGAATLSNQTNDEADAAFEALKSKPLLDGCAPEEVSSRFNKMLRDINPYMTGLRRRFAP